MRIKLKDEVKIFNKKKIETIFQKFVQNQKVIHQKWSKDLSFGVELLRKLKHNLV